MPSTRKKMVAAFVIGKRPLSDGMRILGAHIDSPRLDLKQNPLYEDTDMALFRYPLLRWRQEISVGDPATGFTWCDRQKRRQCHQCMYR